MFDHGAPYFTSTNTDVQRFIRSWEARGLVAEWKESFGSFDWISKKFINIEKVYNYLKFCDELPFSYLHSSP